MRGRIAGVSVDSVNTVAAFPPHPGPLPLGGGEGELFSTLEALLLDLSSILWIHQYFPGSPLWRSRVGEFVSPLPGLEKAAGLTDPRYGGFALSVREINS